MSGDAHLDDACPSGEHDIIRDKDTGHLHCSKCGISEQTLVDSLGHSV